MPYEVVVVAFGERLSNLRKELNLSQQELASRLNIAKSTLAMYETNKREPGFDAIDKLANYFDVTADYLLGRSDSRKLTKEDEAFREKHNLNEGVKEVMFRDMQEQLKDYSEEEVEELLEWMKFKAEQNRKKRENQQGE